MYFILSLCTFNCSFANVPCAFYIVFPQVLAGIEQKHIFVQCAVKSQFMNIIMYYKYCRYHLQDWQHRQHQHIKHLYHYSSTGSTDNTIITISMGIAPELKIMVHNHHRHITCEPLVLIKRVWQKLVHSLVSFPRIYGEPYLPCIAYVEVWLSVTQH